MKKTFLFALLSLVLVACSQDDPVILPDKPKAGTKSEHRVSLDDALKTANALLTQIGKPDTRAKSRRVASVKYLTSVLTRSGAIDTMLYLVNYENNEGFALLGADDRVQPVYAISDEGQLNMEDTVENKGLAMFFRNTEAQIASLPGIGVLPIDSIKKPINPPIDPIVTHEIVVYRQVEPLLGASQRLWGQSYPYNQYCPLIDNKRTPAGCVAVATGLIMSYFQWPISIGSESFPWDDMNSGYNNERIAKLLRILGNRLNMDYDLGGSGASSNDVNDVLNDLGYNKVDDLKYFEESPICNILEKAKNKGDGGSPVLVRGETINDYGHAWIIDGFLQYKTISNQVVGGEQLHDILYHCVWGWAGNSNGYFYWTRTNSFSGEPIEKDSNSNNMIIENGIVKKIKYMGGFTPIK